MTLGYAIAKHGGDSAAPDVLAQLFGGAAGNSFHGDIEALRDAFQGILQPDSAYDLDHTVARCALHATYFCLLEGLGDPVRLNTKTAAGWRKIVFERFPDQLREMMRPRAGIFSEAERGQLSSAKAECELALKKLDAAVIPNGYDPHDLLAPAADFVALRTEEQIVAVEKAHGPLSSRVRAIFRENWFHYLCWSFKFEVKHNQPISNLLVNFAVHRIERKVDELAKASKKLDTFLDGKLLAHNGLDPFASVPDYPPNYYERGQVLRRSIDLLLDESQTSLVAVNALSGMGGVGKTVTAIAVSQDSDIRRKFSDGIVWIVVGRESTDTFEDRVRLLGSRLNLTYLAWDAATLKTILDEKAALIVLDDVWRRADVEPFSIRGRRGRVLYTSRNTDIGRELGARSQTIGLLSPEDAKQFLAATTNFGNSLATMPMPWSSMILDECKGLILALSMIGALLAKQPEEWMEEKWEQIARELRNSDLKRLKVRPPGYAYASIDAAIEISVNDLSKTEANRYRQLSILPEEFCPSISLLKEIWRCTEDEARETALVIESRSLATIQAGCLSLHDLQLDFLRTFDANPSGLRIKQSAFRLGMHIFSSASEEYIVQMFGRTLFVLNKAESIKDYRKELCKAISDEQFIPFTTGLDQAGSLTLAVISDIPATVLSLAYAEPGRVICVGTFEEKLYVYDATTRTLLYEIEGLSPSSHTMGLSKDDAKVVFSATDETLRVWNVGERLRSASLRPAGQAMFVATDPDCAFALIGTTKHQLRLWDLTLRKQLWVRKDISAYTTAGAISSAGAIGIVGKANGDLLLWRAGNANQPFELPGHKSSITAVAITPDGRIAVSASGDGAIRVWETATREIKFELSIRQSSIASVAITPDGFLALTGADDNSVRLWDLTRGRELIACHGHSERVTSVAISPDGRRGYSGSWDQTVRIWDLSVPPEPSSGNPIRPIGSDTINALAISGNLEWGACWL